jgi:hypothetical protein
METDFIFFFKKEYKMFTLFSLHVNVVNTHCYLEPIPSTNQFNPSNYYFATVYDRPEINTTFYIIDPFKIETADENKLWIPCTYYTEYGLENISLFLTEVYYKDNISKIGLSFVLYIVIFIIISKLILFSFSKRIIKCLQLLPSFFLSYIHLTHM